MKNDFPKGTAVNTGIGIHQVLSELSADPLAGLAVKLFIRIGQNKMANTVEGDIACRNMFLQFGDQSVGEQAFPCSNPPGNTNKHLLGTTALNHFFNR